MNNKNGVLDLRAKKPAGEKRKPEEETKLRNAKEETSKKKRRFGLKFYSILVTLTLIAVAEGFFLKDWLDLRTALGYKNSIIQQQTENDKRKYAEIQRLEKEIESLNGGKEVKSSDTAQSSSNESSSTEINKTSIPLEVQNGSGMAGIATTFSNKLKSLGYTQITGIKDADNYNYTGVTIKYPVSRKTEAETIKTDLDNEYTVELIDSGTDAATNIIIIIGR